MRKPFLIASILLATFALPASADIRVQMLEPVVKAQIDLSKQRMNVIVDGEVRHTWKISSGRRGYGTPTGSYHPYRMHKMWYSRKYANAPMPHAVFFRGGYAIHGTKSLSRLGRPASHGCIRLHPDNAKKFYDLVRAHGKNRTEVSLSGGWQYKATRTAKKKKRIWRKPRKRANTQRVRERRAKPTVFSFFN